MKFTYKRFEVASCPAFPDLLTSLRPIIPIRFEFQGMKLEYLALADSGADFCIFHSLVGDILGIDVESGKEARFGGVGGKSGRACILRGAAAKSGKRI